MRNPRSSVRARSPRWFTGRGRLEVIKEMIVGHHLHGSNGMTPTHTVLKVPFCRP
jgi:hypothetical protein